MSTRKKETKAQKDINDLEFIIKEMIRFASMPKAELIAYLEQQTKDLSFFDIPHPSGKSHMLYTQAMERRFYDIAASHSATLKVRQENFIVGRVALIIAREFVERFIKGEGRELNERNICLLCRSSNTSQP